MYQADDSTHFDESVSNLESSKKIESIPPRGVFRLNEVLKTTIVIGCIGVLSFLAFSNSSKENFRASQVGSPLSKIVSLREIPRETVFTQASDSDQEHLFSLFVQEYSKSYSTESELSAKLSTFKSVLQTVDARNALEKSRGGTARHGITKYSDLSRDEFKSKLLKAKKPISEDRLNGIAATANVERYNGSETVVDWSDIFTTPVRDQGYCGSCWAFSAISQIESDCIRKGLLTTSDSLSVQQLLSCDDQDLACDGGWTELAFAYAMQNGIEQDSDYPYTSYFEEDSACVVSSSKAVVMVENYYLVETEAAMADYVLSTGPLSVCADSSEWATYIDGIVTTCGEYVDAQDAEDSVDHCVQVVGINTEEGSWKVSDSCCTFFVFVFIFILFLFCFYFVSFHGDI